MQSQHRGGLVGGLDAVLMTTTLTTTAPRPTDIVDLTGDDLTPITLLNLRYPRAEDAEPPSKKQRVGDWEAAPTPPRLLVSTTVGLTLRASLKTLGEAN